MHLTKLSPPHLPAFTYGLKTWWESLSLFRQFSLASLTAPLVGMILLGIWISQRIENAVVQSVGASAALYTDALIEPYVQELAAGDEISADNIRGLEARLSPAFAGKRIIAVKIWRGDKIVYSNTKNLIGHTFPPSASRHRAWQGDVTVNYDATDDADEAEERALNLPVLEFFAPVRQSGTNRIIALAETYEVSTTLAEKLAVARYQGWLAVLAATFFMVSLQALIVRRGSRTIAEQRKKLRSKLDSLAASLAENEALRIHANHANRRVTEINERFLQKLGADLHDGPVQLLGMSLLRLDSLKHTVSKTSKDLREDALDDVIVIREALIESLEEIRTVSSGLAPPEVDQLTLEGALRMVAARHERRTERPVHVDLGALPSYVPYSLKASLYRFAQEGLNNAFRHAGGSGQALRARFDGRCLEVGVSDTGPGFDCGAREPLEMIGGQGLKGLRDRIESVGGTFAVNSQPGRGTRLVARFSISDLEYSEGERAYA